MIVGKRALPAIAVCGDGLAAQAELLLGADDIVIAFGDRTTARERDARTRGGARARRAAA